MVWTIVGTIASLGGALIALLQARRAQKAARAAEEATGEIRRTLQTRATGQAKQKCEVILNTLRKYIGTGQDDVLLLGTDRVADIEVIVKYSEELGVSRFSLLPAPAESATKLGILIQTEIEKGSDGFGDEAFRSIYLAVRAFRSTLAGTTPLSKTSLPDVGKTP